MNKIWTSIYILAIVSHTWIVRADPIHCDFSDYQHQPGLTATLSGDTLSVWWEGEPGHEMRVRFTIQSGQPIIQEMAIRLAKADWRVLGTHLIPEYRIVSGTRRVTQQQTKPLEDLGIPLTSEKLDEIKWNAFWDAPLITSDELPPTHQSSIPATEAFANHPGMPRKPAEVNHAVAQYHVKGCQVRTNGARLEIVFDGVSAGIFSGYLQYDIFKGSHLIRQVFMAQTDQSSAAFKYDTGIKGLSIQEPSRLVWRDLSQRWQDYKLGAPPNQHPVTIKSSNRLISAELTNGSLALFPPPHSFYWARESEQNLGYSWYRKDDKETFSFGVRQAEGEEDPEFYHNFALYNARPGTWQRMPMFIYASLGKGDDAIHGALKYTHGDQFKPLPGYKVMGHHYHVGLVSRLQKLGGIDQRLNDVETIKGIGIDIFSVIDGVRGPGRRDKGEAYLDGLANYYEAARQQSDIDFLLMPSDENSTGGRRPFVGGHYDILPSKPIYWRPDRKPGQPLVEQHVKYGTVYNLGTAADLMEMTELEHVLISMPHPRSKGSTGYPDAIRNSPQFQHENYFGLGYRWGMGIDASETRLGEYRFLNLWDEANNWMAAEGRAPKFALAISESRSDYGDRGKPPYDDAYGMSPVNYLKLDKVPSVNDMSTIIDALKHGKYFVTSGEVLIIAYEIEGFGNDLTIIAEVEWTFPLEFIEVVWGNGKITDRQIISTTDLQPFGKKRFEIPFDPTGKKWVRLAAWDVATNGAMVQPIGLD